LLQLHDKSPSSHEFQGWKRCGAWLPGPQSTEAWRTYLQTEIVTPVEIMVKGDRYWIGEQEMDLSMIVKILNDRASRDKSWPIKIKVDKETLDAALQSVLLKCRHANLINFEVISPTNTTDKTTQ
jgi:hypothetical protein